MTKFLPISHTASIFVTVISTVIIVVTLPIIRNAPSIVTSEMERCTVITCEMSCACVYNSIEFHILSILVGVWLQQLYQEYSLGDGHYGRLSEKFIVL